MARKSLETLLVEAIESGDLEKSKELALKIKTKTEKSVRTPKVKNVVKKIKTEPPKEVIDSSENDDYIDRPKNRKNKEKAEGAGGVACRTEPIQIKKRKNLFVDDKEECKEDANIALTRQIKNKKPKFKNKSINCKICGKLFSVAPIFYRVDEDGESLYRCNSCCGGK